MHKSCLLVVRKKVKETTGEIMKAQNLMITQLLCLMFIIIAAEGFLTELFPTITFVISFFVLAWCSIYINRHEKELLKEMGEKEE